MSNPTKKTIRAKADRLELEVAGRSRNIYVYRTPVDHNVDDVLEFAYFGSLMTSDELTVYDQINVLAEDGSHYFELMVRAQVKSSNELIVALMTEIRFFDDEEEELPNGFTIEWIGGADLHVIMREGVKIEAGFTTKEHARQRVFALVSKDEEAKRSRAATRRVAGQSPKPPAKKPAPKKATAKKTEDA